MNPYGCFLFFLTFRPIEFIYRGTDWQTVEHYYQAQKLWEQWMLLIPQAWLRLQNAGLLLLGRDRTRQVRLDWGAGQNSSDASSRTTKFSLC